MIASNSTLSYDTVGFGLFLLHTADSVGELEDLSNVDTDQCLECIRNHSDVIVGIKVRLSAQLANGGKHEEEALR